MADQLYPHPATDIASELESEAVSLKSCIGLMENALQFNTTDLDRVMQAQGQLFFLVGALADLQKRLENLASAAYALDRTKKAAA